MKTSLIGRSRFGGSSTLLVVLAVTIGILLALAFGGLWLLSSPDAPASVVLPTFALVSPPVFSAAACGVLVDPKTLGGPRHPEDSVERHWIDVAGRGALFDVMGLAGLGLVVLTFAENSGFEMRSSTVLFIVVVVSMLDFAVRNWWHSRMAHRG